MQKSNERKQNKIFFYTTSFKWLFIVPLLTLYLGTLTSLTFTIPLTYLANQPATKVSFTIWAIVSIITHFGLLYSIYTTLKIKSVSILPITFIILFISTVIPYPKGDSLLGFLHVVSGYLAFILYNYAYYKFISKLI